MLTNIVNQETYNHYNPDISFQADQKITDIINITPSQRVMHSFLSNNLLIPVQLNSCFTHLALIFQAVWVKALFSFENIFQNFWYMGCEKCFHSTTADHGVTFMCNTCKKKYKAQPRSFTWCSLLLPFPNASFETYLYLSLIWKLPQTDVDLMLT